MSKSRLERFKDRKQKHEKIYENARYMSISQEIDSSQYLSVPISELIYKPVSYDTTVSDHEVNSLLTSLAQEFNSQQYKSLFDASKDVLIDQLLKPLKLSRNDIQKVDRNFVFNRNDYEKSGKSIGSDNSSFATVRDQQKAKATDSNGEILDAYTGKKHKASEMELDHVVSVKEMHESGGFMLSDAEKRQFGTDERNHEFTHQSNNSSKKARSLEEWADDAKRNGKPVDKRRTNAISQKAESLKNEYVPQNAVEKTIFVATRGAEDGLKTGQQQGLQQAVAALLSEFISAVYAEAKDVFLNGWRSSNEFHNMSWLSVLKVRIENISNILLSKWKNVVEAFAAGAISGFFTAVGTALLNLLVRTGKNAVRIIREGGVSLFKAINTFVNPPESLTTKEAAHEAIKVFASGLVVTGGIMIGETIAPYFDVIPVIGSIIHTVVTGLITGLGALLVAYLLDKLDLFGINEHQRLDFISGKLDKMLEAHVQESEEIIKRLGLQA